MTSWVRTLLLSFLLRWDLLVLGALTLKRSDGSTMPRKLLLGATGGLSRYTMETKRSVAYCFSGLDGEVWAGQEGSPEAARREGLQEEQHDEQKVKEISCVLRACALLPIPWRISYGAQQYIFLYILTWWALSMHQVKFVESDLREPKTSSSQALASNSCGWKRGPNHCSLVGACLPLHEQLWATNKWSNQTNWVSHESCLQPSFQVSLVL